VKRIFALLTAASLTGGIAANANAARPPAPTLKAKRASKDPCAAMPSKFAQQRCRDFHHSAPGDEYFGRMKMSYLGINNTFRDEVIRSGSFTTSQGVITTVDFADDALRAWANRYPNDPELARSYFLAIGAYSKIYTQPAQDKAWQYMHVIVSRFPNSYFGKQVAKNLALGFTERYFADAVPCPTPEPTPVLLPNGRLAPTPVPTPTEIPTPAPEVTPTPTLAPGQPKVEILTPPCVAATPEPTPAPTPEPTPNATPIGPAVTPAPSSAATLAPLPTSAPILTPAPSPSPR